MPTASAAMEYLRRTRYDNVPMKPQRVYQCMNGEPNRDTCYVTTIGLSQIAGAQFLHVYQPATGSTAARPARWAGRCRPPRRPRRRPDRKIVALSGDYDFQFW